MDYKNGGWMDNISVLLHKNAFPNIVKKWDYQLRDYVEYLNIPVSFDIETTSFKVNVNGEEEKRATMYIWMICINGDAVYGRTWEEFLDTMNTIKEFYNINFKRRIVIYVHNLAYEFSWINKFYKWDNVFAREKNKPMRALSYDGYEFRCSLALSGQSLAGTCKDLTKYKLEKMTGDLDYTKLRNSLTPLTDKELGYCLNDVLGVTSFIKEEMEEVGNNILNVSMTKTGKVRNYIIKNCLNKKNKKYFKFIHSCNIGSVEEYEMMKRAYTGGFTHASASKVALIGTDEKYYTDVVSWDFTSSYPTVLISDAEYPISSGTEVVVNSVDELEKLATTNCLIFNVEFENLVATCDWENYLSLSKCYWRNESGKIVPLPNPTKPNKNNIVTVNNGRIVGADHLITTICHIDWPILKQYYKWDSVKIGKCYSYAKGYLPKEFVQCVLDFYKDKTELKGVPGMETEYQLKKGMLNSCYGAVCTDICNNEIDFFLGSWIENEPDKMKVIEKYNKNRKRWGFWPWAVICTALARRNLFFGITEFGKAGDYLYSDTDCVKGKNSNNHEDFINKYNDWIDKKLELACNTLGIDFELTRPKTVDGEIKPLGHWDFDGHYTKFRSLGSKRYLVEKDDGKIECTLAGSNKKYTSKFLSEQEDPFSYFDDEMKIPAEFAGRNIVSYFDDEIEGDLVDYLGNVAHYKELSYVHIEAGEYNLSIAEYYKNYIENITKTYSYL